MIYFYEMSKHVVMISGYFDICHGSHCEYASNARKLAGPDGLVYAIVNNDEQAYLKKGYCFVPEKDRLAVIKSLKYVDKAFLSIDLDRSVCETIQMICDTEKFKPTHWFNEGDVKPDSPCLEEEVCGNNGIAVVYGESPKMQSSSWIIKDSVKKAYHILYPEILD